MKSILLALFLASSFSSSHAAEKPSSLHQAIDGKQRSAEHKQRDKYRHPQQTLAFFDVKDTMTVVEVWPGEGWYTEILAPYLKDHGKLYAAHFSADADEPYFKKNLHEFVKKIKSQPKVYGKVELSVLQPPKFLQIAPEASVDRILTFRNVHNWMKNDQAAAVFNAMYKALKPGGILGVVEHRNSTLKPQDTKALSGYVTEDYVIALARNAGFEFLDKSEINANSKDTKDYPEGVWTLPPALKLKDKDRKKYQAIGESDRMTIKFIKPK
ncbi:methyltransferase [Methylobacter sp.]|uniref:class I SAM-dependent methyltransferase n=1 Tax=Methylobacter sp. TaxID=2051955 RepID=UPI002489C71E|nr:methyltransferase [Methylobacter sp.]MDI1275914.1 methyltransferase [Methylobacter sp.]MDI1356656.1 methyltransferase [Methylobacter sp.]